MHCNQILLTKMLSSTFPYFCIYIIFYLLLGNPTKKNKQVIKMISNYSNYLKTRSNAENVVVAKILSGPQNVVNAILNSFSQAQCQIDFCGSSEFPITASSLGLIKYARLNAKKRGIKLRYIIEITNENISYCENLMETVELRHLNDIKGYFGIIDRTEYMATATIAGASRPLDQVIYSNARIFVELQQYLFQTLWDKAIPAQQKIRALERGIEPEFYEVITDNEKAQNLYIDFAKSIEKEGLFLLADSMALYRADRLGVVDLLIKASESNGAAIRLICPLAKENSEIVKRISERAPNIKILDGGCSHSGLLVVDNKKFLRFELEKPKAENFSEAIAFVVYSNSKVSIDSSRSFFELIWNERLQYEKLQEANKMKSEFINAAAHVLRTPLQPIIGLSQLVQSKVTDAEQYDLLGVVIRNADRLQQLANDILDVTMIESNSLTLKKEQFSITEVIYDLVQNFRNKTEKASDIASRVKLFYEPCTKGNILVEGDRGRIAQVLSNLLGNAINFTKEGSVSVRVEKEQELRENENSDYVIISIKDTGPGIDSEIFPRLFTKFASKSFEGTGLGLFISKSIIESHGGGIWAENNPDKGATFTFRLPVHKNIDVINT
jgi:signal transduction histidine kinase